MTLALAERDIGSQPLDPNPRIPLGDHPFKDTYTLERYNVYGTIHWNDTLERYIGRYIYIGKDVLERYRKDWHGPCARMTRTNRQV